MSNLNEQKCPACGAPMRFDPASGKMICDYCDTVLDIQPAAPAPGNMPAAASGPVQAQADPMAGTAGPAQADADHKKDEEKPAEIQGFNFAALNDQVSVPYADNLPVYACVSCGADVIAEPSQVATSCPFCGNNIVLTNQIAGQLRPNGLIPFKITPDILPEAVKHYYKGKKLLPKEFFSDSVFGKVTGIYVPFWVFDGSLSGRIAFNGEKSHHSRSGDYEITKTDHYRLIRDAGMAFQGLPVDADSKIDDSMMDSLEPFYLEDVVPFDMRYLAGFTADRFDQKKKDISSRAQKRMRSTAQSIVTAKATAGYSNIRQAGGSLGASLNARYILFPVYLFDIKIKKSKRKKTVYHFAVNGQTGKVVGNLPIDKKVSRIYFLKRLGIVSGVIMAAEVLAYFIFGL